MRSVSTAFKNAMKAPVKVIMGKLVIESDVVDEITSSDDLVKFTIDGSASSVGKTVLRKLTAEYLGTRNLIGNTIVVKIGVQVAGGAYEYADYGRFLVTQCETDKERDTTVLTGYDQMIYSVVEYQKEVFTYPTTVAGMYDNLSGATSIPLETSSIPFAALDIDVDLYENISGTNYRKIIEDIAILGGSVAIINEDNELALRNIKTPTNTVETLTYAEMRKLTIKTKYGKVNSLVLSRQPQEDNVVLRNSASIETDGLTEIKIVNNEIIDKRREDVATDIFPYFDGTEYYPFEAQTIGLGWFEVGDKIIIEDDEAIEREVRVMGVKITVDGSLKETIWSNEPSKTETNYARAGGIANRIKNTEIVVDKQNQEIASIVSDVTEIDGVMTETFTRIDQDLTSIIQSVQTTGGINLLRNSAFYQTEQSGVPTMWTLTGSGTYSIGASSEALSRGSLSANIITLNNVTVKQNVSVVQDTGEIDEINKTYYSFKVLLKKSTVGTATVRVYNDLEDHTITIPAGTSYDYDEVEFEALLPKRNYYTVELTGSATSNAVFADAMFSVGKYPSAWQQANGEILNTNVNINENGIIVKSSVFAGDYTAITPLEFSGYSKIGSTIVKAFTLNKDQTEVSKLYAKNEMSMPPIKIVPITTGSVTGWAYVKRSS